MKMVEYSLVVEAIDTDRLEEQEPYVPMIQLGNPMQNPLKLFLEIPKPPLVPSITSQASGKCTYNSNMRTTQIQFPQVTHQTKTWIIMFLQTSKDLAIRHTILPCFEALEWIIKHIDTQRRIVVNEVGTASLLSNPLSQKDTTRYIKSRYTWSPILYRNLTNFTILGKQLVGWQKTKGYLQNMTEFIPYLILDIPTSYHGINVKVAWRAQLCAF